MPTFFPWRGPALPLILLLIPGTVWARVDFHPARHDFICGRLCRDLAAIDFNEDGKLDLACVLFNFFGPSSVKLMIGDGEERFAPFADIPAPVGASAVFAADFDEDGHTDLITCGFLDDTIGLHRGDGRGGFATASIPFPGVNPFHVNGADLNGDGHLDLVAGGTGDGDGMVYVLRGDGAGGFALDRTLFGGAVPQHVAIGDLNADGVLDLAVADSEGEVILHFGDGQGGFRPYRILDVGPAPVWIAIRAGSPWEQPMMAVALRDGNQVEIFRRDPGIEDLRLLATLSAPGNPAAVAFIPPTLFHDPDLSPPPSRLPGLAVASQSSSQLLVWGSITEEPLGAIVQDSPTAVRIADWNRDGAPDFAVPGFNTESVSIIDGVQGTAAIAPRLALPGEPTQVRSCDLNGDARADLAVLRVRDRRLTVLVESEAADFTGKWEPVEVGEPFPARPEGLAVIDLGDDANPDFAVGEAAGTLLYILKSSKGYLREELEMAAAGTTSIASADMDGDGAEDLAATVYLGDRVSVHWSDRSGGFLPASGVPVGGGPLYLAVADLNGDGLDDLATADYQGGSVSVVLQQADRRFAPRLGLPVQVGDIGPNGVAAGDLDGDGDLDLVATGELGLELLRGDGSGGFASALFIPTAAEFEGVRVADLDGDGFADVLAADRIGNAVVVVRGPSLGPMPSSQGPELLGFGADRGPSELEVVELDGDGRPDVAVADRQSDRITLLLSGGPPLPRATSSTAQSPAAGKLLAIRILPTPFRDHTTLDLDLASPATVHLRIYDSAGRLVAIPFSGPLPAGSSVLPWDGSNPRGSALARGIYFYRLEVDDRVAARGKLGRF